MLSAEDAFNQMSAAQQREIRTAAVLTTLGPVIRAQIPAVISAIKRVVFEEVKKLEYKKEKSESEEKLLSFLQNMRKIPASLDGIRQFEQIYDRAKNTEGLLQIAKRCYEAMPSVLQFSGFASLIKQKAISKFISFAMSWRYSGIGYEAPSGMSAPFSGYDDIINSLVGHPKVMAEFRRQGKLWEEAHNP